jgi:hypothetical protein
VSHSRVLDYILAFSVLREGVGGVAGYGDGNLIPNASITKVKSVGTGGRFEQFPRKRWDNAAHYGKGHEFATKSEVNLWESGLPINGEVDTELLGTLLLHALGLPTTSTPSGATNSRDHVFVPQNPSAGLQLPSGTMICRQHAALNPLKGGGLVVESLSIRGGKNQYATYDARLVGNGRLAEETYTFPAFSAHRLLRDSVSTFAVGTVGSPTAMVADIVEWELSIANNLRIEDGYYPRGTAGLYDAADASKGMIAGRMYFGNRALGVKFTVLAQTDTFQAALAASTAREILITSEGDTIETGFLDTLTIQLKDVRYTAKRLGDQDGLTAWQIETLVHMPSTGLYADLLSVTLRNPVAAYGSIPA